MHSQQRCVLINKGAMRKNIRQIDETCQRKTKYTDKAEIKTEFFSPNYHLFVPLCHRVLIFANYPKAFHFHTFAVDPFQKTKLIQTENAWHAKTGKSYIPTVISKIEFYVCAFRFFFLSFWLLFCYSMYLLWNSITTKIQKEIHCEKKKCMRVYLLSFICILLNITNGYASQVNWIK